MSFVFFAIRVPYRIYFQIYFSTFIIINSEIYIYMKYMYTYERCDLFLIDVLINTTAYIFIARRNVNISNENAVRIRVR